MSKISILEIYDIETNQRRVVREFPGVIEAPNWLSDGDTLLYNSDGHMYRYSLSRDEISPIDTGIFTHCNNDHVVSADNRWLCFSCHPGEHGSASQIYMMPLAGGEIRRVTKIGPSYLHGISFDGNELTYCAFRNDVIDIYTLPSAGGDEKRLTDGVGYNDGPEYSPDDRHIWFNSTREGLMQVYRMDRDGGDLTRMTHTDDNEWFPHVSPDMKKVVYLTFKKGDLEPHQHLPDKHVELWLMDYDGGNNRKLTELYGGQGTINVNSWAPDSKRFAFVSYRYE